MCIITKKHWLAIALAIATLLAGAGAHAGHPVTSFSMTSGRNLKAPTIMFGGSSKPGLPSFSKPHAPRSLPPRRPYAGDFHFQGTPRKPGTPHQYGPTVMRGRPTVQPYVPSRPAIVPTRDLQPAVVSRSQVARPVKVAPNRVTPSALTIRPRDTSKPKPPVVKVSVPIQSSPLDQRLYRLSGREARSYSADIRKAVMLQLEYIGSHVSAGKRGEHIRSVIAKVRLSLGGNAGWSLVSAELRQLLSASSFNSELRDRLEECIRMTMVCETLEQIGDAGSRRGCAMPVASVPVGKIHVIFDPLLAFGTGLVVNNELMVCGTERYERLTVLEMSAAEALSVPVGVGEAVPDVLEDQEFAGDEEIILRCREDGANVIHFTIDQRHSQTLNGAESLRLNANKTYRIDFDNGNSQGATAYSLKKPGVYEFRIVDGRWDLKQITYQVTIDNRDGAEDFQVVVDNRIVNVPAGEAKSETSSQPVSVTFDRGRGPDEPARKSLNKSGIYKVAVNPDTNLLDLFPSEPTASKLKTANREAAAGNVRAESASDHDPFLTNEEQ